MLKIFKVCPFLLSGLLLASSLSALSQEASDISKLSVRGIASLSKPADQLSIHIAVSTSAKTALEALENNNNSMQGIIQGLLDKGIDKQEMQSGQISIQPVYSTPPTHPPADWQAEVVGYQVFNEIILKTDKLAQASEIIDSATTLGASRISQLVFEVKDPEQYRAEVLTAAVQAGRKEAETVAQAAGVQIGRVLNMRVENTEPIAQRGYTVHLMAEKSTPIMPGEREITGAVEIEYEILHKPVEQKVYKK